MGENVRSETLREFPGIRGRGALVPAQGRHTVLCVGGHGLRNIFRNPPDFGIVAALGFARERHSAGHVWNRDGDLSWSEVSHGLLGLLRFWGSSPAGAVCLQAEQQTGFSVEKGKGNRHDTKIEIHLNHRGPVYRNSKCHQVARAKAE